MNLQSVIILKKIFQDIEYKVIVEIHQDDYLLL
jgi:hypothetical protein